MGYANKNVGRCPLFLAGKVLGLPIVLRTSHMMGILLMQVDRGDERDLGWAVTAKALDPCPISSLRHFWAQLVGPRFLLPLL